VFTGDYLGDLGEDGRTIYLLFIVQIAYSSDGLRGNGVKFLVP
jgi:hypothetical protein